MHIHKWVYKDGSDFFKIINLSEGLEKQRKVADKQVKCFIKMFVYYC